MVRLLRRHRPADGDRPGHSARYFAIGDRDDLLYEEKLAEYRRLVDAYFEVDRVRGVLRRARSPAMRELVVEYFGGAAVRRAARRRWCASTFPAHEHEPMVGRHRGLVGAWVREQEAAK